MADPKPLTFAQIVGYAKAAGFNTSQATTMAAVAMAESGGRYWAVGDNFAVEGATRNPDARYDRGLFQINSMHGYDANRLVSDPAYNAKAAFEIFKRQGFNAWTTYKSGAHRQYLGQAQQASGAPPAEESGARQATSTSSTAKEPDKPKSRQELLDYIAENYPDVYGLLSIDAEVKDVLLRAAENEYSAAKLRSELSKTSWWKKTAATARDWDASYALDRATGEQKLKQTRDEIEAQANRIGVALTPKQLADMALNVNRLGWSQQQVAESLSALFKQRTAKPGLGTATVDELRAVAADYGVQVSDHTLTVWTQRILGGNADRAGFQSYVVKQAKTLFPTIADDISEGTTVRDYFDPYVQSAARILGVNPEDVDLSDNKWRRVLTRIDPATNKRAPMGLDDFEVDLRTNPIYGYNTSLNGRREAGQFGAVLARELGYG